MDWAQILVILLSVILAIFLLLAIVLVIYIIKVTRQIKSVTSSAQRTAENIESTVDNFSKASSPMIIVKMMKKFMKESKRKDGRS
jgi:uncharacterized protein involved in cysteine biosynthesis